MTNRMDTEALNELKDRLHCIGIKTADVAIDAIEQLEADRDRLQVEVERLRGVVVKFGDGLRDAGMRLDTAWNDAIEAAAHLIECDGDAMNGKADAARLIRALKRPTSEVSNG